MQPDPVHVNQFTTGGTRGRYLCTGAAGAMALDAFTGGRIRVGAADIDRNQDDHDTNGIGLDDVATAWKRGWGLTFTHGAKTWGALMARWRAGDGAVLQGRMAVVPREWRTQKDFVLGHALYVSRQTKPGWLLVFDPIATAPREWPEWVVQAFYASGLALAGWGTGSGAGTGTAPTGQLTSSPDPAAQLASFQRQLREIGINDDPNHVITAEEAQVIAKKIFGTTLPEVVRHLTGKTVAQAATGGNTSFDPLGVAGDIAGAIGQLPAAIDYVFRNAIFLVAILAMVLLGLYILVKGDGAE